jgi:SAM-dependent methyltransferase
MSSLHLSSDHVAHYYDDNTSRFLHLGGSGEIAAIHRKIWAPGVENAEGAFLFLHELVAQLVQPVLDTTQNTPRLLDLGCGVGGTATWLAQKLGAQVIGVTNSAIQQQLADQRARTLGLTGQCRFIWGDFHDLPRMKAFHVAYAIESFIHAADPQRFFDAVAGQLAHRGRLMICDDFLAGGSLSRRGRKWVERFKTGWHANSLLPQGAVLSMAKKAGFELLDVVDLSPYLRPINPIVLSVMQLVSRLPLPSSYGDNLSGGAALQVCIKNGWTKYLALTWEKSN